MKTYSSFAAFGVELMTLSASLPVLEHDALETACVEIEKRAKEKIGDYQQEAGPFPAWAPLAESTKDDRLRGGFTEDDPLLRTGDLRDSIEHKIIGHEGHVGSDSDIALYQELGTSKIPARSFLGGAAFEKEPEIREMVGTDFTLFLAGGNQNLRVK